MQGLSPLPGKDRVAQPRLDGDSLVDAMLQIMHMPEDARKEMIEKGRAWLREQCNAERYAKELFELFGAVIKESRAQG